MRVEDAPNPNISPPEQIEEIKFPTLVQAFLGSEEFEHGLAPQTKILYSQALRRFTKFALSKNECDVDKVLGLYPEFTQGKSKNGPEVSAIRTAIRWATAVGLTPPETEERAQSIIKHRSNPDLNRPKILPLTDDELNRLLDCADTRDRALIITIMLSQQEPEKIRALTTNRFRIDNDRKIHLVLDDYVIQIPEQFTPYILEYFQNIKPGPLFPGRVNTGEALTRQGMHLRLKDLKKATGLDQLSHKSLVKTGIRKFGNLTSPKPRRRNFSQIPKVP